MKEEDLGKAQLLSSATADVPAKQEIHKRTRFRTRISLPKQMNSTNLR